MNQLRNLFFFCLKITTTFFFLFLSQFFFSQLNSMDGIESGEKDRPNETRDAKRKQPTAAHTKQLEYFI